jgi:cytochrome c biogenesis factor
MTALGEPALWFALLMAVGAALTLGAGARLGRAALMSAGTFALTASALGGVLALGALSSALVSRDFSLRYVARYTSVLLSRKSAVTALWAGASGSLLWVAVAMSLCAVVATLVHNRERFLQPAATATMALLAVVAHAAVRIVASPFSRLATPPPDGRGLHPQLLHPAMALQPPVLLLGLALLVVPFAFTVAMVVRADGEADRDVDRDAAGQDAWRTIVQRWLLASWLALTLALAIGLWWAQQQLGWFGYYFTWEPYASAPVLPWLAVSALLVVLVSGADRASSVLWTAGFVAFTFLLAIAAVVRLRAGIADSIRAVEAAPSAFLLVIGGVGLALVALVGLIASRRGPSARAQRGGKLLLVGATLMSAGLLASHWRRDRTHAIDIGQVVSTTDPFGTSWRFTSQGLSSYQEPDHTVLAVGVFAVHGTTRVGLLTSQQRQYFDANDAETFAPSTTVGSATTWRETVSLGFLGPIDRTTAAVRIAFVPLVSLLWLGVASSCLGMVLAAWPSGRPAPIPDRPQAEVVIG